MRIYRPFALLFCLFSLARAAINAGVTILLSLTVFLNLVAESMPTTSDAVPLIGTTTYVHAIIRNYSPLIFFFKNHLHNFWILMRSRFCFLSRNYAFWKVFPIGLIDLLLWFRHYLGVFCPCSWMWRANWSGCSMIDDAPHPASILIDWLMT